MGGRGGGNTFAAAGAYSDGACGSGARCSSRGVSACASGTRERFCFCWAGVGWARRGDATKGRSHGCAITLSLLEPGIRPTLAPTHRAHGHRQSNRPTAARFGSILPQHGPRKNTSCRRMSWCDGRHRGHNAGTRQKFAKSLSAGRRAIGLCTGTLGELATLAIAVVLVVDPVVGKHALGRYPVTLLKETHQNERSGELFRGRGFAHVWIISDELDADRVRPDHLAVGREIRNVLVVVAVAAVAVGGDNGLRRRPVRRAVGLDPERDAALLRIGGLLARQRRAPSPPAPRSDAG